MLTTIQETIAYLLWRPPSRDASSERLRQRYYATFADEARRGRKLEVVWRTIALSLVAVLVMFVTTYPGVLYYLGLIAIFIVLVCCASGAMGARASVTGWNMSLRR